MRPYTGLWALVSSLAHSLQNSSMMSRCLVIHPFHGHPSRKRVWLSLVRSFFSNLLMRNCGAKNSRYSNQIVVKWMISSKWNMLWWSGLNGKYVLIEWLFTACDRKARHSTLIQRICLSISRSSRYLSTMYWFHGMSLFCVPNCPPWCTSAVSSVDRNDGWAKLRCTQRHCHSSKWRWP